MLSETSSAYHRLPLTSLSDREDVHRRSERPLLQLLAYVRHHRGYALLTTAFGVMGFLLSFVYPWIIGSVVDLVVASPTAAGAPPGRQERLLWLSQLALATAVMHAAVVYGRGHFNVHLGDAIVADIRRDLFRHLQKLSLQFYTQQRTGNILARVLHDVRDATALIYTGIIVAGLDALQLALAIALLTAISWKLTLACVLIFPLYALVFVVFNPRVRRASERVQAHFGELSGNVTEQISGQALVKTYVTERREAARFAEEVRAHHRLVVAQSHEGHLVASAGEVLVHLGTTVVIGYGGWLALSAELSAGTLTRFLGYVIILFGPVRRFAELNITYQSSVAAMRRIFRVLAIRPAVRDHLRARSTPPLRGDVRFESVSFHYATDNEEARACRDDAERVHQQRPETVLDRVSFEARAGERIAIVGVSGAGKTTLLSLLPRLYDVTGGRILVDGIDVRDYTLTALRSSIAIVQQDSFVFSGSVRDNICYARADASERDMIRAAKAANAHEFIVKLPNGYDTRLGERGVNLSGGQRQRISIARALLKDPRILILDEATSSLDAGSEAVVERALHTLMRGRTSFIIAHRLSTVRGCDRIIVLEGGRVVESGTHAELLARAGTYAHLVRRQIGALHTLGPGLHLEHATE